MRLTTVDSVRQLARFDNIPEFNAAFGRALDMATGALASLLRTKFDRDASPAIFIMDDEMAREGPFVKDYFDLGRGLVDLTQSFKVYTMDNPNDVTGSWLDITSSCTLDAFRGLLGYVSRTSLTGRVVRVEFTSGLAADPQNVGQFLNVPTWLDAAAQYQALNTIDTLDPRMRFDKNSQPNVEFAAGQVQTMLAPYIRYMPYAKLPL